MGMNKYKVNGRRVTYFVRKKLLNLKLEHILYTFEDVLNKFSSFKMVVKHALRTLLRLYDTLTPCLD